MEGQTDIVKRSWDEWSDSWYVGYRTEEVISNIIKLPASVFHPATFSMIMKAFPDLRGKRICVPSSGDNHAVFAFHLMGAHVTSCDISERQLENSSAIAQRYGWDIEFICDDTMKLSSIKSNDYDFVYTSNGVHVWIHDLNSMYTQIHRVLKPNGAFIMYDIHPFMRPFGTSSTDKIHVVNPYDSTGPFGEIPTYKWRIQDMLNAMMSSGFTVKHMEEMFAVDGRFWVDESKGEASRLSDQDLEDFRNWQFNPLAALPQWLSIYATK